MAAKEDLGELKDYANILNNTLDNVLASAERINRSFSNTRSDLINMDHVFQKIVETSDDLPKNIAKGKDLHEAILKDAKLFNKVQEKTISLLDKANEEGWKKVVAKLEEETQLQGKALEQTEEYKKAAEFINKLETDKLTVTVRQFELMKRQAEARRLDAISLGNITDALNDLGAKIRNPDAAFSSMLKKSGSLPDKIFEASKGSKNLGQTLSKLVNPAFGKVKDYANVLFSTSGILVAGVALAAAALVGLYNLFKNFWEFMDKNVVPATAKFNKQIGGTGPAVEELKSQMHGVGQEFLLLGESYESGAALVRDFASGLKSVELDPKTLKTGKELMAILQLSGEEAGSLALQFQKQTGSLDGLNEMMNVGAREAKTYGLPINDVLRDLGKFPNILARFNTANRTEFAKSAAKARSYGLDIGKVDAAFGERLDTFEGSSTAAAKLNAIFGTTINSFELMLETDPTKRMQMLRKELLAQGREWNSLSKYEQNVIASSLGVDKEMASMMLASDEERKKLEAKQRQKDKEIKINERWNKGMSSIKSTLIAWGEEINKVMRSVTGLISTIFGWDKPAKNMTDLASGMIEIFRSLTGWIDKTNKNWNAGWDSLDDYGKALKTIVYVVQLLLKPLQLLWEVSKKLFDMIIDGWKQIFGLIESTSIGKSLINMIGSAANMSLQGWDEMINIVKDDPTVATSSSTASLPSASTISSSKHASSKSKDNSLDFSKGNLKDVRIEMIDFNVDGKKFGELQVKLSTI